MGIRPSKETLERERKLALEEIEKAEEVTEAAKGIIPTSIVEFGMRQVQELKNDVMKSRDVYFIRAASESAKKINREVPVYTKRRRERLDLANAIFDELVRRAQKN